MGFCACLAISDVASAWADTLLQSGAKTHNLRKSLFIARAPDVSRQWARNVLQPEMWGAPPFGGRCAERCVYYDDRGSRKRCY
jgi:hypothetical protein